MEITPCDVQTGRKMRLRRATFAFTEHGALMAASVLNTPRSVEVRLYIVGASASNPAQRRYSIQSERLALDGVACGNPCVHSPLQRPDARIALLHQALCNERG